jgi:hypothetical protein
VQEVRKNRIKKTLEMKMLFFINNYLKPKLNKSFLIQDFNKQEYKYGYTTI